jgi:hypothetical protein
MPGIINQQGPVGHWLPLTTHLELVAGDDCKVADGRGLAWTSPSWPDLSGATLTMVIGHDRPPLGEVLPVTWTGTVPASPPSPSSIFLEVTSAQTGVFASGMYDYTLQATLTNGDLVTVAVGKLTVQASPTTPPIFS